MTDKTQAASPWYTDAAVIHTLMESGFGEDDITSLARTGADVNARDRRGQTALHQAAERGNTALIAALVAAGAELHAREQDHATPLDLAICADNPAAVALLLELGADPNADDPDAGVYDTGQTVLHMAAVYANPEVIPRLIGAGAGLEARDHIGRTPLHHAANWSRYSAAVDALINAGADSQAKDEKGFTPLHLAAAAELDARDQDGRTPLHMAARYHITANIRILTLAGADSQAKDAYGQTPLDLAMRSRTPDAAVLALLAGGQMAAAAEPASDSHTSPAM